MGANKKNELQMSWNQDGSRYEMWADGTHLKNPEESDFFRIMMDNDYYREMVVPSHLQKGTVTKDGNLTTIHYPQLVDGTGRVFQVEFTVFIEQNEHEIRFSSKVQNHDSARVNEVQLPFLDFDTVCDSNREKDTLFRPRGMGERIHNPWKSLEKGHTEYMSADYREIWSPLLYPRPSSMAWMGLESAGKFLYIGKEDQPYHICTMNAGRNPRNTDPRLVFTVCHYPLALEGETLNTAAVSVSLADGDWRDGSRRYRQWSEATWHEKRKKKPWVENFTGWQRIILRHQYGEVFWKYKDLIEVYENGKKYGIDTVMVFGWWKGRFDNGYPLYEPDDTLGGEEELKAVIKEIQRRGGNVILYTNGVLMDVKSDFYQKHGKDVAMLDLDSNPYMDHYQFSNQGTILRTFGYKTFAQACHGAEEWKQQLIHNGKVKLSMEPDGIFFDQAGGHRCFLCFNKNHKHGNRGDIDPQFRIENFKALYDLLGENQALGTENTVDLFDPYIDYHHGCDFGNWYAENVYPQLFLNTFPEAIMTNRFIHDERADYRLQLNFALICGYRYDVSIYRGRVIDMDGTPNYANHVKRLLEFKEKYHRFFYPSRFCMKDLPQVPDAVLMTEYVYENEKLVLFLNCEKTPQNVIWNGKTYEIPAYNVLSICGEDVEYIEG